jgi:hypothetical protein
MEKYQNGKIYLIKFKDNQNAIYVGSTIQTLEERFRCHKKDYNKNPDLTSLSKYIKNHYDGNWSLCYIELLKYFPCNSKKELHIEEGNIIKEKATINKNIAGRERSVRLEENKEKIAEKQRQYRQNNKEKLKIIDRNKYLKNKEKRLEQVKNYYIEHKEEIQKRTTEKVKCECGALISKGNLSVHKRTLTHISLITTASIET